MKYHNVNIIGTGIHHPNNRVSNDYYIKHFEERGQDIKSFLDKLGKKYRYVINNSKENSFTLAVEASKKALKDAGITADMLDMIIFSSDNPEYLIPSNALMINSALGATNAHIVYDLNSNCVGMVVALDQVSRIMKTNTDLKYALVVGGVFPTSMVREDCKYTYPAAGDGGAAVVLESKEEDYHRGFIDSKYLTLAQYSNSILYPACGLSKALSNNTSEYDKKQQWIPFRLDFFAPEWSKSIKYFGEKYDFSIDDLDHYFLSQYSKQFIIETADYLNINNYEEKFEYIGDEYGYTGTTSPIFALHNARIKNKIKPNSRAVFCSVGAGVAMCSLLYKF
jgi:3-oxoacyl-[acyl-carrier-protein] synthase-3